MADPLSITASVIAVSTLAAQLTKFIAHALHASDEVDAFKSELEDLQVVATRMRLLYEEQWTPEHQASVDQIKRILDHELEPQLRVLDAYLSKQFSGRRGRFKSLTYPVLRRKVVTEQQTLRSHKTRMVELLNMVTASSTRRIEFTATAISVDVDNLQRTQDQGFAAMLTAVNMINDKMLQPNPPSADINSQGPPALLESPLQDTNTGVVSTQSTLPKSFKARPLISCVLEGHEADCAAWCTCACHAPQWHMSFPTAFERIAGQLLMGFSVHSWLRPRCTAPSCKRSSKSIVRLSYKFPAWWLSRAISLSSQSQGPGLVIHLPYVRPSDADVFEMVAHGRLESIKHAFTSGTASIYDVENTGGHTLLHVSSFQCISSRLLTLFREL
jgi:hypothetical protein